MLAALREARFITTERIRIYSLMLLAAYVLGTGLWFASARGLLDWQDRPLGTDFSQVWVAGTEVLAGQPDMPFDNGAHISRQREIFGSKSAVFTWGYPPYFLAVAALLATLPYLAAFFVWQGLTFGLYVAATRAWLPRREALLPILAFPAVYVNFGHGQTGFIAAALLGGGLWLLDRRPWLAGLCFGLLAFKPQLGLLIPIALAAGGHWRAIVAAGLTIAAMTLGSWGVFGTDTWQAFFDSLAYSRINGLEYSNTGFHKMLSLFAAVRLLGGSVNTAYIAHGALVGGCAMAVAILWRGRHDPRLKAAGLLVASLLATPYGFDYELMVLAPALAAIVAVGLETGFQPWEKTLLFAAWCMPLVARNITDLTLLPVGFLMVLGLFGAILARSFTDDHVAAMSDATPQA